MGSNRDIRISALRSERTFVAQRKDASDPGRHLYHIFIADHDTKLGEITEVFCPGRIIFLP